MFEEEYTKLITLDKYRENQNKPDGYKRFTTLCLGVVLFQRGSRHTAT